jgi:K+-sensing histidine kinase KdpD
MLTLLSASVSHELITPIKCIGAFANDLVSLISNEELKHKAELIHSSSMLLLS